MKTLNSQEMEFVSGAGAYCGNTWVAGTNDAVADAATLYKAVMFGNVNWSTVARNDTWYARNTSLRNLVRFLFNNTSASNRKQARLEYSAGSSVYGLGDTRIVMVK